MKTYTMCGSMRFETQMRAIAYELETVRGYNILQCVYSINGAVPSEEEAERIIAAHYRKIDLSDGIFVVNIGGYIGEATKKEIEYAERNNKEILYYVN